MKTPDGSGRNPREVVDGPQSLGGGEGEKWRRTGKRQLSNAIKGVSRIETQLGGRRKIELKRQFFGTGLLRKGTPRRSSGD